MKDEQKAGYNSTSQKITDHETTRMEQWSENTATSNQHTMHENMRLRKGSLKSMGLGLKLSSSSVRRDANAYTIERYSERNGFEG